MTLTNADSKMVRLAGHLSRHLGLNFAENRLGELKRGLVSVCQDFGFQNVDSCIDWLLSTTLNRQRIEILASHLTVGETYFFREKKNLEIFKKEIMGAIRSRHQHDHRLRIWSAGCSSGEEPYSIAITLMEAMPDISEWEISILATDINPDSLQKASGGIYRKWSFRDCPQLLKQKYFREREDAAFEVIPDIKKMVSFAYHNLAEDPYPSVFNNTNAMDVIFCRNVLMYFTPEIMKSTIEKLNHCLVDDGVLVVSATETSPYLNSSFSTVCLPEGTIYRKGPKAEVGIVKMARPPDAAANMTSALEGSPFNDIVEAIPIPLEAPIEITSNTTDPLHEAESLFLEGRYNEALKEIETALKTNSPDTRAIVLMARIKANQGNLPEAEKWCRKSIQQDRLNPVYHYLLATILHEQGQLAEAVTSLERAVYLDPGFVLAYFTLGNLTAKTGKMKESARYYKNALALLRKYRVDDIVPESDGITAGRLIEVVGAYSGERG